MTIPNGPKRQKTGLAGVHTLNTLYFYLTEGCNLACRHCWMGPRFDPTGDHYPTLPVALFETAIREAKPLGLSGVKLTGGEPLLHPHFTRLLEIVRREELKLTIETNGLLCTPEIAAEIAKSPNRFVSVSIDGTDAATHDWVRGVPGAFAAARQAVRNLVAAGTRPQVIFTVMRINAGQVDAIVRMVEELGAASLKFNVVQPTARGESLHENQETLNIADLIELGRHVEQDLAPKTKLKIIFDYPHAFRSLHSIASGDGCGACGIFGILGVIASGHYALCGIGEQVPELVFGEVGEARLEELWRENATLNGLREGLPERLEGICGRCLMKERCLGSCVAQNYYSNGSLWAPYWFCEQAEEAGLFPTSRLRTMPHSPHLPQSAMQLQNSNGNTPGATFFAAYVGPSMNPTLREPEVMEIMPYDSRPLRVGDVAFFLPPEFDRPVVHRIIRVTPAGISTLGDNNTEEDTFLLQPKSIKGQVVAAWRGQKRRKIAGGLQGRLTSRWFRWQRVLDRGVSPLLHPLYQVLHPLYRALSHWGLIAWMLPAAFRPRVVVFHARGRDQFQLLLGQRIIGRYDNQRHQWLIQRPFRLFVDGRSLPRQQDKD